jgi:hypothetical protein
MGVSEWALVIATITMIANIIATIAQVRSNREIKRKLEYRGRHRKR